MKRSAFLSSAMTMLTLSQPVRGSILAEPFSNTRGDIQQAFGMSFKAVLATFWDTEFPKYQAHEVVRKLIDQIDNHEMAAYLAAKGIAPDAPNALAAGNLVGYLRENHIGTEAAYAWIDLQKGDPDFIAAVQDWQAMGKEFGYEFIPTYYLLFKARLESKRDAEVWADLFKATFENLPSDDRYRRTLMLLCLMPRAWKDLARTDPPAAERFAFLCEHLKAQEDMSSPYAQLLVFDLYGVHFASARYAQAAEFGRLLQPQKTALFFAFMAQALAKDVPAATATLAEIEALLPRDEQMISTCNETIKEMERIGKEANKAPEANR